MNEWLAIAIGFVLLIGAADLLVRGSVFWALVFGISPMVVGLTLVAFGTSAPELMVGIESALKGRVGFATGSVLGSNVANIGLILGIVALSRPIANPVGGTRFELAFLLATSLFVLFGALTNQTLGPVFGTLLVASVVLFTVLLYRRTLEQKAKGRPVVAEAAAPPALSAGTAILNAMFVVLGLLGLKYGGDLLVGGAVQVAESMNLSETLVGVTILAIGTSLPELATSVVAARKGEPELALGNVLGSNVFNVSMVLGITAWFAPLPLRAAEEGIVAAVGLVLSLILAAYLTKGSVSRSAGALLLGIYLLYLGWSIANA